MRPRPPDDASRVGRPGGSVGAVLVCMGVVFLAAVATRAGLTAYRWRANAAGPALHFADERDYWAGACSLAEGGRLVDADGRHATRMPLYPALLTPFVHLRDGESWARLAQGVLGALVAPIIALLGWRLGGRRTGWVAGLFVAVDPWLVYFSQLLLTETLFTTMLAAFCLVGWPLAMPDGRSRVWRWPVAGALFLAMVYLRPSTVALLPVWAVLAAIGSRRARGSFAGLATMFLMLAAGLAPWVWRNARLVGEPVLLTTRLGISLYDGQGPQADGSSNLGYTRTMPAHTLPEGEWNRWFRDEAARAMWNDPWRACRLAWVKAKRTWDPLPHAAEAQSTAARVVSGAWSGAVFCLLIPGLVFWRRRPMALLVLLLPAAYLTGVHMIFVGSVRYRLPVMPLIELLSAVGVCGLVGRVRSTWRPTLPPSEPVARDHRRVSWPERLLASERYGRKPVPAWRRRLAMGGLLALALGYYGYQYFTSDERIRSQAVSFLTRFTGGEVRIGHAKFGLFSGISLRDVTIALPPNVDFDPTASTFEDRQAFAAVNLQLRHEPFSLLTGRLRVVEILAVHPTVTLVKNAEYPKHTYNWQMLFPPQPKTARTDRTRLPIVRIRNAQVRIIEILGGERRTEPRIELSALALPDRHRFDTYTVPWRKAGDSPERGKLFYNLKAGSYSGTLPTVPMTTVKAALPPRFRTWLETLEIAGQIRPEQIRYDARHGSRATIQLERIRLSVPMASEEQPTTQAAQRFLKLTEVEGQLVLTRDQSTARITGKLNDAPCRVHAVVTDYAGPLEAAGFDVHLVTRGIRLPDRKDPAGAKFIERLRKVRGFFKDFDPHGLVDADFHLIKSPGEDMGVILRGSMSARGCDASYRMFPYRLTGVTGTVHFTDDGVVLDRLAGDHGSGFVVVSGHVDGTDWWSGFRLDITGDGVPLDPVLYNAVPEKFRNLWRRFDAVGMADVHVKLQRSPGGEETGPGKWSSHIEADLIDARARFVDFPYGLRHVSGRLEIDNERIHITDLTGRHGTTSAGLAGQASYGASDERELELRLEACDVAIDDDLLAALSGEAQDAFRQIDPSGRADLLGRVFMSRGSDHVSYNVAANLREARVCYRSLPYPVDKISGRAAFSPDKITLSGLTGRHDKTRIAAHGTLERREDDSKIDLTLTCDRLRLDKTLYDALPASLKKRWDTLSPGGEIHLKTHIRRAGAGDKAISTHDTTVHALGGTVRYQALPLSVTDVRGRIHVTDEVVELHDMTAMHGKGKIRLNGKIPLIGRERTGRLQLKVDSMPFDEALRDALPARVQRTWDDVRPAGTFDLDLTDLSYRSAPDRPTVWSWRGRITAHDVAVRLGFDATELEGSLLGRGTVRSDGSEITVEGDLNVKRAAVNRRVLTDLTGRLRRPAGSGVLLLDDLLARTYGGRASGIGRVDFGATETRYGMYMIVRDMALGPFLDSTKSPDAPPTKARGTVDGRLYLKGTSGRTGSRQGTGEVRIRHAQMYKLPFVLAMLSAINITIPDVNAFHDARATYHVTGNQLVFDEIDLRGRSLSMLGAGSMDIETEMLDLTFITGSPHRLPHVPLLTEFVQGASRELMEISVTGPLGDPTMRGRPLRTLRTTLKALLARPKPHATTRPAP